jgi:hypothetical protein
VPLIEIQAVAPPDGLQIAHILAEVNGEVALALGCRPDAVWSTWRTLRDGEYLVGPERAPRPPRDTHVPLVHVWINRPPAAVDRCVAAIESALRRSLSLDADPFVTTSLVSGTPPGSVERANAPAHGTT